MKWFLMIMSFVLTRMSVKQKAGSFAWDMYEEVIYKSRQVTMLALVGFAAATLFCAGLLISLLNLTSQYDLNGFVSFTATLAMGLVLLAIAGASFAWIFVSAWPGVRNRKLQAQKQLHEEQHKHEQSHHPVSAIEQAVSVWIMDIVKEREVRRAERAQRPREYAPNNEPAPRPFADSPKANASSTSAPLH